MTDTVTKKLTKRDYARIWKEAVAAGHAAAEECKPQMMVVTQRANPFDDTSAVVKRYEPTPVCGFGWVNLKPATSGFARWLKSTAASRGEWTDIRSKDGHSVYKGYYGGLEIHPHLSTQSMDIQYAYAQAMAAVFASYGFTAYAQSRMD